MFCKYCGKELSTDAKFCSSCGSAVEEVAETQETQKTQEVFEERAIPQPTCTCNAQPKKNNVCCLVGFILSFVSYVFLFNDLCLFSLAGFIVSLVGLCQCKRKDENWRGFGLAGTIIGAVAVGICFIIFFASCVATCALIMGLSSLN